MPHGGGGGGFAGSAGSGASSFSSNSYSSSFYTSGGGGGDCGLSSVAFCVVIILFIFGVLFSLIWYPYTGSRKGFHEMIKGENFRFNYPPFWYESIKVSSDAEQDDVQALYYYQDCPKSATEYRETTFANNISSKRYHYDGFYFNKNSVSNLTWQTSSSVVFEIYFGQSNYNDGTSTYHHKKSTGQTGFIFNIKKTGYYIFYWDLGSSKGFTGEAQWNFTLTAYDPNEADKKCPLGESLPPCKYEYHHPSSCVVVDNYNLEYDQDIHIKVDVEGRGGRYFTIVMLPMLMIPALMFFCVFAAMCVTFVRRSKYFQV